MATKTKVGTLLFGTYSDGAGSPNQSHLVFAQNCKRWFLFYIKTDTTGNPGTHVIGCYMSDRVDIGSGTAVWTAQTDSPNLNAGGSSLNSKFSKGRAFGCCYLNNLGGNLKDLVVIYGTLFVDTGTGNSTYNGVIRCSLTSTGVTWGSWGSWETPTWNSTDSDLPSGACVGITSDRYVQLAAGTMHSELDCSVCTTVDRCDNDTWNEGNQSVNASVASGAAAITGMANQTRLEVGMSLSIQGDWNTVRMPSVKTIDSGTQCTMTNTSTGVHNNSDCRWWQGTLGLFGSINRTNSLVDSTMTHECGSYGFASLDDGNMVLVYDNGGVAPPNVQNLKSIKSNQSQAAGFWPSTTDGTGSVNVFGSNVNVDYQDWFVDNVDRNHIYVGRLKDSTTVEVNQYSVAGNTWSAIANQPPTVTGTIKAGGGVVGVDNGSDFWCGHIDGTNNNINICRYNTTSGTWGTWQTACAVGSTATKLSCSPVLGPITGVASQMGLVWAEQNGASWDAYVTGILIGDPPDWDGIDNRVTQWYRNRDLAVARGL